MYYSKFSIKLLRSEIYLNELASLRFALVQTIVCLDTCKWFHRPILPQDKWAKADLLYEMRVIAEGLLRLIDDPYKKGLAYSVGTHISAFCGGKSYQTLLKESSRVGVDPELVVKLMLLLGISE